MTLGDFLKVYGKDEPFWINYPDDTGFYDRGYIDGCEMPFWEEDEIEYITHGGDGILTIELKYQEA